MNVPPTRSTPPDAPRGLARLLDGLPRERREALARRWRTDSTAPGFAALFRAMTDPATARDAIAGSSDCARLVVSRLVGARRPLSLAEVLTGVPFAEDDVERAVLDLEEGGIVWKASADGPGAEGRRWYVPRELARALHPRFERSGSAPPPGRADGVDAAPVSPRPRPPPAVLFPGGQLPAMVSVPALERGTERARAARAYADHCAEGLGVWVLHRRAIRPGPRHAAWIDLDLPGQVEALARFWVVDDVPDAGPESVRDALWKTLERAEPQVWYDLDEVTRLAARLAACSSPAGSIGRREVDRGMTALRWIGVIEVGRDRSGGGERQLAIQVSRGGSVILRRRYDLAPRTRT